MNPHDPYPHLTIAFVPSKCHDSDATWEPEVGSAAYAAANSMLFHWNGAHCRDGALAVTKRRNRVINDYRFAMTRKALRCTNCDAELAAMRQQARA